MSTPIVNLHDHERAAQAAMSDAAWAYFSGGAADEITLRRNVQAWQSLGLAPRVLQDLRGGHTRCQLLGQTWPMPLLVAPMATQRWAHADGESGMALAAAAQGCGMVLSHQTSTDLSEVARLVVAEKDRGPLWFQLYGLNDRGALLDLLGQHLGVPVAALLGEGQQRTLALALKLAQGKLLEQRSGKLPIYLMDDIFGELDPTRRNALMSHLPPLAQKWITTTHLGWLQETPELGHIGRFTVKNGSVGP